MKNEKITHTIHSLTFLFFIAHSPHIFAYDPLDCLNDIASLDSEIIIGLATRLCSGAWSPEPVKCYQNVSQLDNSIPRGIAIDLCAGTVDAERTLDCYYKAGAKRQLNRGLSTSLCGAKKSEKDF